MAAASRVTGKPDNLRNKTVMPYDKSLADRLQFFLKTRKDFSRKEMFGGVGFLLNGNMCVGVYKKFLILRLGKEEADRALKQKQANPFDITGRAMSGWVMVEKEGIRNEESLRKWVESAVDFVQTLPPKKPTRPTQTK
ncbi:MAG: TfoX family protein [Candidatus Manganitrophaceae bacterium]|nr:MAG: TfoX family protein [Candidatus Manganitrophaceae bacterium]